MKKLLALALAALLSLASLDPAAAFSSGAPDLDQVVAASGCEDVNIAVEPASEVNAYFGVDANGQKWIVFTLGLLNVASDRVVAFVLAHELAHCVQWQEGRVPSPDRVGVEMEADRMAATTLCGMGYDGIAIGRDFFLWLAGGKDETLTQESPTHGSYLQRIWSLERAPGCTPQYPAQ